MLRILLYVVIVFSPLILVALVRPLTDHTFVYTGAVRKIHELITSGELGELYYFNSVRVNLGLFQHDVSVVWDLAAHDVSILDYLSKSRPCAVYSSGCQPTPTPRSMRPRLI